MVTGMNIDPAATAATVIDVWNGAPVERLHDVLASDYRGHMLHLKDGDRDATAYPGLITQYRAANPGTLVSRRRSNGRWHSPGLSTRGAPYRRVDRCAVGCARINISRFDTQGRLAEEWAIWSSWMDDV